MILISERGKNDITLFLEYERRRCLYGYLTDYTATTRGFIINGDGVLSAKRRIFDCVSFTDYSDQDSSSGLARQKVR